MATKYRISSETATGVVDGVNTIFTTTQAITRIELLTVNSLPYAQYSFTGNTIVLDDAPSSGIVEVTYEYETNKDYLDNSGWIVGETCSGTVDGINKVFNTFFPISLIDEVRVNGVAVIGYSFNGNSILLASAPILTHDVTIDYFRSDYGVVDYDRTLYPTIKDIRDVIYMEISQDDTSVQYQKELVNSAIRGGISELVSRKTDKSRDISFSIEVAGFVGLAPVNNSISALTIDANYTIPPIGRILTVDGDFLDYTSIADGVISISKFNKLPKEFIQGYVGYRLPRSCQRVKGVFGNYRIQPAASLISFVNGQGGYIINNGFIYFPSDGIHQIEVELKNITTTDDDSLVYIDEDEVDFVIYYALRQLYASRENEKLLVTSQLLTDKINAYYRKIGKKRIQDSRGVIKTSSGFGVPPDGVRNRMIQKIKLIPYDNIDGGSSNN